MPLKFTNKKRIVYSLIVVSFLYAFWVIKAYGNDIRILGPRSGMDPAYSYFVELTRLALSKNEHLYPKSNLVTIDRQNIPEGNILSLLNYDYTDIIWTGSNPERESLYLPIHIPLFRGLLGYRVLLIRQEDKDKFLNIKSPEQLKKLIACQGIYWPDSDILEANGYLVLRVTDFNTMFKMLDKKRCDYFPRSIYEGYAELASIKQNYPDIILMDELILHYQFPIYYFVNKNNTALAERLEQGLIVALADGSLMNLMKKNKISKHLFPLSQWQDKRYFELTNDKLDKESSLKNAPFWLKLKENK